MNSRANEKFWKAFEKLPATIQRRARETYRLWQQNHYRQSLQFKQIHPRKPIYSVRIGMSWRAVGVRENDTIIWFWIGSHEEYNKLVLQL